MGCMHTDSRRHIVMVATQKFELNQTITLQQLSSVKKIINVNGLQ